LDYIGGTQGKRIQQKSGLNDNPDFIQTKSDAFADWEIDRINLGKSGRQFFGDDFSSAISSRTYINNLTQRDNSAPVKYNARFAVGTSSGMELIVSDNGNQALCTKSARLWYNPVYCRQRLYFFCNI
jgi:hypothetical protein